MAEPRAWRPRERHCCKNALMPSTSESATVSHHHPKRRVNTCDTEHYV